MDKTTDIKHEALRLRLLAAVLELQHYTSRESNVIPIPGGDRVIAIGTPAQVRALLEIAPIGEASIGVLDAIDSVTGADIANIACFATERFYLADDVDGLIARCWQTQALAPVDAAAICEGVAAKSRNHLFRSGAKICAGEIRAARAGATVKADAAGAGREPYRALLAALDAYMYANDYCGLEVGKQHSSEVMQAIEAARAALSTPPVAWMNPDESCVMDAFLWSRDPQNPRYRVPVYADQSPATSAANNGWLIARETVVEMPDGKKELGYTTLDGIGVFTDEADAHKSLRELNLPIGWVVMHVNQLIPGYIMPEVATCAADAKDAERYQFACSEGYRITVDWSASKEEIDETIDTAIAASGKGGVK
jgi:hypothetical protein